MLKNPHQLQTQANDTFISYDDVRHIAEMEHLNHLKDGILETYEVSAERSDE